MKQFFEDVLKIKYRNTNSQDNPDHEKQIEELLIKHNLSYAHQPNGTQRCPDFLVTYNGNEYPIECKSSRKTAKPKWNSGVPKKGITYIFTSGKYNQTTVFFGEDIVEENVRAALDRFWEVVDQARDDLRKNQIIQDCSRGFCAYPRRDFDQYGGAEKTDYFIHKDRSKCEQRVLNYNW
jgi:hypothetical protein